MNMSAESLESIFSSIQDGCSRAWRRDGILKFGNALADDEKWQEAWNAAGGTKGLVELFAKISVTEVKALCGAIGTCSQGRNKIDAREQAIEELLRALLPSHYPGSEHESNEKRPFQDHYAQMVYACSAKFIGELLDAKDKSNPLSRRVPWKRLIRTHWELIRKRVIDGIFKDGCIDEHLPQYLEAFVYREPPLPSPHPKVSASMDFAMKVLKLRLKNIRNNERWPSTVSEADIFFSLMQRSRKRRLAKPQIHDLFMLGLRLLEAKPQLKFSVQSKGLWVKLIDCWKRDPEFYDDAIVLALRLELSGPPTLIGENYLSTSRYLYKRRDLKWMLLRLYCVHVPEKGVDIDTTNDSKPLAKQSWSTAVFYELEKEQAIKLLEGILSVNPEYDFLQAAKGSILSDHGVKFQHNFNVILLMTLFQKDSEAIQKKATVAVNELRKKSATSREQPERAEFAIAASLYAIASGNLDLYGETVTWQQRFVRDPLTTKDIFGRAAVTTSEGIELLSGIPDPLPENVSLAQVSSYVKKANQILMTFYQTMEIARREPSWQQYHWTGLITLFDAAISKRVDRVGALGRQLQSLEADLYTAIWASTIAMLEKVDRDFINSARGSIERLIRSLSSEALVEVTTAMLETGNQKREKKEGRQPGDEILENISYYALRQLSQSERPELAQQLILRTIIDRPDASSWHRQFLTPGFMNSLSAKDAHQMLLGFATAIGEKLEEQSYVQVPEKQAAPSAPPQSLVKVTTVKYLAQLLDNAEFISVDASVEILVELFRSGTHIDIRLATLDSLLSLLDSFSTGTGDSWRSNPLVEMIMKALETVIPIVGSVNERRPPRQQDWAEAKSTGKLPDTSEGLAPLLSAILEAPIGRQYTSLKKLQAEFMSRILLPALQLSQSEHQKWVALFLAKHGGEMKVDDLPSTPITQELWNTLINNYTELIPLSVLEDFNEYSMNTIAQPKAVKELNKPFRENADLRNAAGVKHWISIYGSRMSHWNSSGTEVLVNMIRSDRANPPLLKVTTFSRVVEMVMAHASLFLDQYDKYKDIWNTFIEYFRPPTMSTHSCNGTDSIRSMFSAWRKTSKPILEDIIALVFDRKKRNASEHKLIILPSTRKLALWLLPYPCFPAAKDVDKECQTFAEEIVDMLDTFLDDEPNVLRWPRILEEAITASKLLNTPEERLKVAYHISELEGGTGTKLAALNLIKVTVAIVLIKDAREGLRKTTKAGSNRTKELEDGKEGKVKSAELTPWGKLIASLQQRVKAWENDSDEAVREKVAEWMRGKKDAWRDLLIEE
ncbi:hypothetical protein BJ875DRAFT_523077 [Amylocarpus encephaloides]|uniref:Uncharacterized protein n=1 Tax=Amylocarpus encephaloides TaxID=45428 RepID=A0A9P7Y9B1_9HELO|nr:hypothetical protein BJ875DRAFT_523077 [Amylocarpus encephaloides]